ncbi:uncharacterized protein TNCV_4533291 [Trichonephila clavipes]|nr:uncharacterized protein TNCV_4533291 [Trichonephila clavipes]
MVSFNLTIGAEEPHHPSQCLDPADDLDGVFFHPELTVHMSKQADLPAYLKQLALQRIGGIPIDTIQVYMDGSRDDYYQSGSGIYIESQDHILKNSEEKSRRLLSFSQAGYASSQPRVLRPHQAGSSRRSLASVKLSESVRCNGPGLALLTNGGVQQHIYNVYMCISMYEGIYQKQEIIDNEHKK